MEAVGRRYRSRHVAGRGGVKCAGGHLSVRGGHGPHGSVAMRTSIVNCALIWTWRRKTSRRLAWLLKRPDTLRAGLSATRR